MKRDPRKTIFIWTHRREGGRPVMPAAEAYAGLTLRSHVAAHSLQMQGKMQRERVTIL
jgi:hypothetical protein